MPKRQQKPDRPEWWEWEIELSPHLVKRMSDRGFNETDLRAMLQDAGDLPLIPDHEPGRWRIPARHPPKPSPQSREWEIIVEPSYADHTLVVITAYPIWSRA